MTTHDKKSVLLNAVRSASQSWQSAFNAGDPVGCAALYEKNAVMHARPFGTFKGLEEIQAFWQKLIVDGFSQVEYIGPTIDVIDDSRAVLSSDWQMNKAKGVIHKELWILQDDGTAKLREDDFEALG